MSKKPKPADRPLAEVLAEKAKELAETDPAMSAWLARLAAGDEAERKKPE